MNNTAIVKLDTSMLKDKLPDMFIEHISGMVGNYLLTLPADDGDDWCMSYRDIAKGVLLDGVPGKWDSFVDWLKREFGDSENAA